MRAQPIIASFNGGELSPLMGGRPDTEKYQAGLSLCENFIPRVQGALVRRGGTQFMAEVRNSGDRSWLARFEYSVADAFVLEFGDRVIRFYKDRGPHVEGFKAITAVTQASPAVFTCPGHGYATGDEVVLDDMEGPIGLNGRSLIATVIDTDHFRLADRAGATIGAADMPAYSGGGHAARVYQIVSPWAVEDLTAEDGSFALRYVQSGDVMYFAHAGRLYAPYKLTRVAGADWRLVPLPFKAGPFKDQNIDKTITVRASAATGTGITLTATSGIFQAGHVGSYFYLEQEGTGGIKPWYVHSYCGSPTGVVGLNTVSEADAVKCISDGKYYTCSFAPPSANGVTGSVKPEHTEGRAWDGDGIDDPSDHTYTCIGVEWEYKHAGYGWVKITGFSDDHHVTADVVSLLPTDVVSAGTHRWAHAAWSDVEGWPSCVTFFRQRLTFARDQRLWFSVAGDYENFAARPFDQIEPDSALSLLIASARGDTIQWLAPVDRLLVGTGGTVFAIGESTTTQPFGPSGPNARSEDQALSGSAGAAPVVTPGGVIVVEKAQRIVSELAFDGNANKYAEADLTVFAEHITRSGVIDMTFVKQPHSMICCALKDGSLRAFTYMKAQGVSGWHRHRVAGRTLKPGTDAVATDYGVVESVTAIPSPRGQRDDLWLIVRRTLGGVTRRHVEVMTAEYEEGDDSHLSVYGDAAVAWASADEGRDHVYGLDHLEGEWVSVKADGAAHPDRQVIGGRIALSGPVNKAVVGLAAPALARLMPLEAGGEGGTAQGRPKRINRLGVRLVNALGGELGPDFETMEVLEYRTAADAMGRALPLFTGDKRVEFPGDYDGAATVALRCDGEFPFTLVAMMPEVTTYGG
jgi:hypothetical protein